MDRLFSALAAHPFIGLGWSFALAVGLEAWLGY